MRRPSLPLVLTVVVATACGGGGTAPSAVPNGSVPLAWAGTAKKTVHMDLPGLESTTTWEIKDVQWIRNVDPDPAPLAGESIYKISSGQVTETVRQVAGPCTLTGEVSFPLKAEDGFLIVGASGVYSGYIKRSVADMMTVTNTCLGLSGSADIGGKMHLEIDSTADFGRSNSHLQGTKVTVVAGTTQTSTWDFTAAAWTLP
jgi:hypothetical protein